MVRRHSLGRGDFPEWEPVHNILFKNGILGIENVGGDLDAVTGKRCTFAFFPWNWDRGDGCIIRLGGHDRQGPAIPHRGGRELLNPPAEGPLFRSEGGHQC